MLRTLCVGGGRFVLRQLAPWPWPALLGGLGCGFILLSLLQLFFAQLGTSQPVMAAAWSVIGFAWVLAYRSNNGNADLGTDQRVLLGRIRLESVALIIIALVSPLCWGVHDYVFSDLILNSRTTVFLYAAVWAVLTLGMPVWCVARLSRCDRTGVSQRPAPAFWFGIAMGITLAVALVWGSLIVITIAGCLLVGGTQFWKEVPSESDQRGEGDLSGITSRATVALMAVACGGLLSWFNQVIGFLFPATIFTLTAILSGVLLGMSCGCCALAKGHAGTRPRIRLLATCWLLLAGLSLSVGFSTVVFQLVSLTGAVSQVWMLHCARWLLVCGCVAPLGYLWANSLEPTRSGAGMLMAMLGGCITSWLLLPSLGWNLTCYVWLWCIALAKLVELVRTREKLTRNALLQACVAGTGCLLIIGPFVSSGVRPELAARLLFSTNVFLADQAGMPKSQLAFLDDGRLETMLPSQHGIFTVWKSTVARHQIRENGVPRGTVSTNLDVAPQDTAEVLISLLPLTLHPEPRRVVLLGLGSGVPAQTALSSPVQSVTLVEGDRGLVDLVQNLNPDGAADSVWQDERLQIAVADPALWVTGQGQCDVLISNPAPSSLIEGVSQYTREFYRRAAHRLTADGIFCQRFQFVDYGPQPLLMLAATLREQFKHVLAVELAAGEMAWLATNSEAGLIRPKLVERMQGAHVRELMAQVGWDWSVMLTLGAYDNATLDQIIAKSRPAINTAASGRFTTQLPGELMRWGAKPQEIFRAVTNHAGKILNWVGADGENENVLRRLAEVRGQQELIAKYPDQYWGYRSQVRKQITSRPVSPIEQIKHEESESPTSKLPPDDRRRLRYFSQLSKAIHGQQPRDIVGLNAFSTPYDPLISLFMHQELAEIAARVPAVPARIELTHRLHTIYFSPSFDMSVRNALAALRLVLDKPDCTVSAAERWDVINGLLQILQNRWTSRGASDMGNPELTARDAEENIVLGERTLEVLPDLASAVGLSSDDWKSRRRVIERNLLGPLRTYRDNLQPLADKQRYAAEEEPPEDDDSSDQELRFPAAELMESEGVRR